MQILIFLFVGYIIGYYFSLSLPWFLALACAIHYAVPKIFSEHPPLQKRIGRKSSLSKCSFNVQRDDVGNLLQGAVRTTKSNETNPSSSVKKRGGVACINTIVERLWQQWDSGSIKNKINDYLNDTKTKPMSG